MPGGAISKSSYAIPGRSEIEYVILVDNQEVWVGTDVDKQ